MTANPFASVSRDARDDILADIARLETALEVQLEHAHGVMRSAERQAPEAARWLRLDVCEPLEQALDTIRSIMDDAREVGQPDGYDALRQKCADKRWHEGRVL